MDTRDGRIHSEADMIGMPPEDRAHMRPMNVPPSPRQLAAGYVGRNDPCPCGSGRKFKKCCLARAGNPGAVDRLSRLAEEERRERVRREYGESARGKEGRGTVADAAALAESVKGDGTGRPVKLGQLLEMMPVAEVQTIDFPQRGIPPEAVVIGKFKSGTFTPEGGRPIDLGSGIMTREYVRSDQEDRPDP